MIVIPIGRETTSTQSRRKARKAKLKLEDESRCPVPLELKAGKVCLQAFKGISTGYPHLNHGS